MVFHPSIFGRNHFRKRERVTGSEIDIPRGSRSWHKQSASVNGNDFAGKVAGHSPIRSRDNNFSNIGLIYFGGQVSMDGPGANSRLMTENVSHPIIVSISPPHFPPSRRSPGIRFMVLPIIFFRHKMIRPIIR